MSNAIADPMEPKIPNRALSGNRPIRILHVLYKMDLGGAETWLMHILRHIDRQRFRQDFLVHDPSPGAYDAEAKSLGSRIIYCPYPIWPWTYARRFKKILAAYGPYDIIHSHLHSGGFHLFLASQAGVPMRISHNHSAVFPLWDRLSFSKKFLIKLSYRLIFHYATAGLAASRLAAIGRFGPDWQSDPRWQVLYCGIDLNPFRENIESQAVRQELGIPADVLVIGHVGRFAEEKNHRFILRIAAEISRLEPDFRLLLVGQGPLRPDLERLVDQAGLRDKVIFTGPRADVPRLMLGAMDVFLFPSLFESLGIVVLEAQAAGLPCLISETIPAEAEVVKPLFRRLSLSEPPSRWAEAILAAREVTVTQPEALKIMEHSPFNIETSCRELVAVYQTQLREAGKPDVQKLCG
jgi:glycosyltransferase involved in cell wall biosynthesis